MEAKGKMEKGIRVEELFWNILFGWRQIICFGIIFAVLCSGLKYVKDVRTYGKIENTNLEQAEKKMSEDEMLQVSEARVLMERIEECEKYLNQSALMQIDPYKKPIVELQYYIESDYSFNYTQENQNDYTGSLLALYYNYIIGGEMSQDVIENAKLPITQEDMSELWSVSQVGYSILVKVVYPDTEKMDEIANTIKILLEDKEKELQEIGKHELKLLGQSQNTVVDTYLIDRKTALSNNLTSLNSQLSTLKTNMKDQQLELLGSGQSKEDETDDKKTAVKPKLRLKYVLVGSAFGVFLVCIWIICKLLFATRLRNPEDIRDFYGMRLFGEVTVETNRNRPLEFIDKKLFAIKNRKMKKLVVEEQIKNISAQIALSCKQQGINCIYMTGSSYEKLDANLLKKLKQELDIKGVKISEGENIFYDSKSLQTGTEVGNFLLIEQVGKSIYEEIDNEINLAKEHQSTVLGVVVFV